MVQRPLGQPLKDAADDSGERRARQQTGERLADEQWAIMYLGCSKKEPGLALYALPPRNQTCSAHAWLVTTVEPSTRLWEGRDKSIQLVWWLSTSRVVQVSRCRANRVDLTNEMRCGGHG